MSQNSIRKIPLGMFHGWKKLNAIYLRSNAISEIEGELFEDNKPYIFYVGLHHNLLETISLDNFPESVFIEYLSISANLLNFIPENFLNNIHAGTVDIFGNPFHCTCLKKIEKIFLERDITVNGHDEIVAACKDHDISICGYSIINCQQSLTCTDTVDRELTRRLISQMKQRSFHTVTFSNHQCASFAVLDEHL